MSRRNLASLLFAVLAVTSWTLGYLRHSPLLDAVGSILIILALVTRIAKNSTAN